MESGTKNNQNLPNQKYPIEDLIILSNNNGNRMVRLLVTAVVIPEES